ncbi:MAG: DUF362 domain-containing protein [Clostridia bacterium]|nr:DUF362 domain-containing protein [Clostridia bacterium]
MKKVSLEKCTSYQYDAVRESIRKTISNLGGLSLYVQPGERVLLKVNLLMKKRPEEATTTHPVFVQALADELLDYGCHVLIGDSPGGPFTEGALRGIYKVCGYEAIAEISDVTLNWKLGGVQVKHEHGVILKQLTVVEFLKDVDKVISVSKLKTHGMMKFTGAVKNMFGIIPGLLKAEYHFKMPEVKDFSQMLVDVCSYADPVLSFMDGIVGMEGAGPSGGDPREIGVVIGSDSPYHLDVIATQVIGIEPLSVPTIARSMETGFLDGNFNDIEVVGLPIDTWCISDFKAPNIRSVEFLSRMPRLVKRLGDKAVRPRPVFMHSKCVGCGDCAEACPPHVIEMRGNKPYVNLDGCIRCFCCQELCPALAVEIKRPWMMKWLTR